MQNTKTNLPLLPDGYILVKAGGRPKKEARDAAVFLARFWRMNSRGESATKAEQWIVDTWEQAGKDASRGISETAHVRAAIMRSRERGLSQSLLSISSPSGLCTAVECKKHGDTPVLKDGARSWHWVSGMTEALQGEVKNVEVTVHQEIMHPSPIAVAVNLLARRTS
ncbi:hypothetical protein [Rhodoferax sp. PAMC 29310]|uniref:hypothetical protein n=1 Tax=Rhodoferax sp. PAMC 29310 TaxID=2822760 RepID=UPI001B33675D|nr:hypothetical protein [Rhodoferax sp. PAMC 29310]